jgi:hypothetical protein
MDWRQFLCDEIDRKIALIRLVMPENVSPVAISEVSESDVSAYVTRGHRDPVARTDAILAEEEAP